MPRSHVYWVVLSQYQLPVQLAIYFANDRARGHA